MNSASIMPLYYHWDNNLSHNMNYIWYNSRGNLRKKEIEVQIGSHY